MPIIFKLKFVIDKPEIPNAAISFDYFALITNGKVPIGHHMFANVVYGNI
jgi:hypothetical protein